MIEKDEIRRTVALLRAEAERLERLLESNSHLSTFDPRTSTPPVVAKPKGTAAEEHWCTLLLFTGLLVHEVTHGRGASDDETREIAAAAGYVTGNNAWNGWSPAGSQRISGLRAIDAEGLRRVQSCYDKVERRLPDDLAAAIESRSL